MATENNVEQQALLVQLLEQANVLGKQYTQILESQHAVMSNMFGMNSQAIEDQTSSAGNLQDALESLHKQTEENNKGFEDQTEALNDMMDSTDDANDSFEQLIKTGQKLTPVIAAVETFAKTLLLMKTSAGAALDIVTGFAGTVFRLGLSLLALPIGILNGLFSEAQRSGGGNEFRRQLEEVRKIFGDLAKNESKAIVDSFRNVRGELANTGLSTYRILGNMAERLEFVSKTAQNMGVAFSLLRGQLVQNVEAIAAYTKGLGLTEGGQKALANRALATGTSITEIGRQMTTYAYQVGEAFGFNGKSVSRDVGEMMGDISTFGNMSVQSLTNISVYARKLGIEFSKLKGVVDKFDNFESAAESVGQLSQAFGIQLDTMQLVNAQDPAERIEALRKAFFGAGKSIETMNRQERSLLATQTGLDQETLALVFSQKSQATSYADIQRKSEGARKQQLTQAEAMEKLSNSIERLVKDGQALQGGLFDILFAGFAAGIRRSGPFRELMRSIRHLMREVFQVGRAMGMMFVKLFPGIRQVFEGLAQYLSPRGIGRQFQVLRAQFRDFLTGLTPQNAGQKLNAFITNMRKNFFNVLSGPGLNQLKQGLMAAGRVILSLVGAMIRYVGNGIAEALKSAAAFIRNPRAFLEQLRAGASAAGGGIMSVMEPLIQAFVDIAPVLYEAMKDLLSAAWGQFKTWAIGFMQRNWMTIGAVLFGPAIISAGISAIATSAVGALVSSGSSIIAGALGKIGGLLSGGGGSGPIASAMQGLSATTQGADGLATTATNSRTLTNPAAIGKMIVVAAVVSLGVAALVRGMVALAELIKQKQLTAADVGLAAMTITSAVGIATAVGGSMVLLLKASSGVQAGATQIVTGLAAIAVVGSALALGMLGLVTLFQGVKINDVLVASGAMIAAIAVAGAVGLAAMGFAVLGAGVVAAAIPAALGLAAVGVVGTALALGMRGLIALFSGVNLGDINKVGIAMSTTFGVVADLAGSMALLAGIGIFSAMAPAVGIGMLAVAGIATALKFGMEALIAGFQRVNLSQVVMTSLKVDAIVGVISKLALVGAGLAIASPGLVIAATFSGAISDSLKTISNSMIDAVSGLISRVRGLPTGQEMQDKVNLFTSIIRSVVSFGTMLSSILQNGSIFEGVSDRVRATNALMTQITGSVKVMVTQFLKTANELPDLAGLTPKIQVITGIVSAVGNFARGLTNIGTRDEDAIEALQDFAGSMLTNLTQFLRVAMPQISDVISTIASSSVISGTNPAIISAFGSIIGTIFTSLGTIVKTSITALTRQGSVITDAEELADTAPALGRAIGSLVSGLFGNNDLFGAVNQFLEGFIRSVDGISSEGISKVKAFGSIIGPLFSAISSIAFAVGSVGASAVSGNPDAMNNLRETVSTIAGGITQELSGLVTQLVETLGGISTRSIQTVQRSSGMLSSLFTNITGIFDVIGAIGSEGGGAAAATKAQNGFRNLAEGLFGNANSGWSLKAFVDLFNQGGSMAGLVASITGSQSILTSAQSSFNVFKESITAVFGVVDTQFTTGLTAGMQSTMTHVNTTISEIIDTINEVHAKINNVGRSININAALANLGESIGTANPARLQIARGDLTINITVNVKMDIDDVEEAIATRANGSSFVVAADAVQRRPHLLGATPTYPGSI